MTGGTGEYTICNVRGLNLNYNASKLVNFENVGDMILRTGNEPKTVVNVNTGK